MDRTEPVDDDASGRAARAGSDAVPAGRRAPEPPSRVGLRAAAVLALAGAACASLVGAAAPVSDVGEIIVNFSLYTGGLAIGAGLLCAGLGWRGPALAALALGAFHAYPALRLYVPVAEPSTADGVAVRASASAPALVVAQANVNYNNTDAKAFLAWVDAVQPDVLGVLEVTPFWDQVLDGMSERYPYRLFEPLRPGSFRLGLVSRIPIERGAIVPTPFAGRSYLEATLAADAGPLQVLLLHPMRPGLGWGTDERNGLLRHVARTTELTERAIVLADLNATGHSPMFAEFLATTGLGDSRRGFGWCPSWRSVKHVPGIWLDLDHIFVGRSVTVIERQVGPDIGSDHRPIWARVELR